MEMAEGLLFHTNYIAEKKKFDIKDGKAVIDDKEFIVDRVQPFILLKKRFFVTKAVPLYLLKWDKIEPIKYVVTERKLDKDEYVEIEEKGTLKTLEVEFPEKREGDVLPFYLRETHDMRYLKHMKTYASDKKPIEFKQWMLIPIALVISFLLMLLLQNMGLIKLF